MSSDYCHFNESGGNTTFQISLFDHELTIYQSPGTQALGHGAVVWDASVVFAMYMMHNPRDFQPSKLAGRSVLELGSGCSLAGAALMLRGAQVTFTDLPEVVAALTQRNVEVRMQSFHYVYIVLFSYTCRICIVCIYLMNAVSLYSLNQSSTTFQSICTTSIV
jgi:hypothetical protein